MAFDPLHRCPQSWSRELRWLEAWGRRDLPVDKVRDGWTLDELAINAVNACLPLAPAFKYLSTHGINPSFGDCNFAHVSDGNTMAGSK